MINIDESAECTSTNHVIMNRITQKLSKKMLATGLLATLISFSTAWAVPGSGDSLKDYHRLGIDFGFGRSWGRVVSDVNKSVYKPNFSLGAMYGYILLRERRIQFVPEIGVKYGFTKRMIGNIGAFKETSMHIPLIANVHFSYPKDRIVTGYFVGIGYELDIAFSSRYIKTATGDSKDLLKLPKFSRFSGSIVLNGRITFWKGIFLNGKIRIPTKLFSIEKEKMAERLKKLSDDKVDNFDKVDDFVGHIFRMSCTSFSELSIGVNIMELL